MKRGRGRAVADYLPKWKVIDMVSGVESSPEELDELMRQAEAAQLAPFRSSAGDPVWVWPVVGVMVFVALAVWEVDSPALGIAVMILYCADPDKRQSVRETMTREGLEELRYSFDFVGVTTLVDDGIRNKHKQPVLV